MSTMTYRELTSDQQHLFDEVEQDCTGADVQDLIRAADAPAVDKAAVAEVFGGEGAGLEFLR
jgi:hypothetical protein